MFHRMWSIAVAVLLAGTASAQLMDHLECYRAKDPLKLKAVADLNSALGLEPGCSISRTRYFCAPASKTVTESNVQTMAVSGQELTDERVCYRIKCAPPFPPDQDVIDQFGTRTLRGLKPAFVCTPVVHPCGGVPGQCGGFCDQFSPAGCESHLDCSGHQLPCGCYGTTTTCMSTTSTTATTTLF